MRCASLLQLALLTTLAVAACEGATTGGALTPAPDGGAASALAAPPDVKAPPAGAQTTASGLAWRVLTPGTGTQHPKAIDQVKVHYTGWTTDGVLFDTSLPGEPAMFFLNMVIKGWSEGVQLMVEGEKSRFWIPAELAYGTNPPKGYPAGMLVFDIELIEIKR